MLFFRNFKTIQVKTQNKMRFFGVLIISLFLHIHLYGAVTKINHKEVGLAINCKGAEEVRSYPDNVENTIVSDSIYQSSNVLAENSGKQFHEDPANIISTKTVSKESSNIQEEDHKIIFISAGTTVVGLDQIYEVKIEAETRKPQSKEVSKVSFSEQTNVALSEKKAKVKLAHLRNKIQEKPDYNFSSSPSSDYGISQRLGKTQTAVVISYNVLQKYALASVYDKTIVKIESQLKKQKFYTSHSYFLFRRYTCASLRAPPKNS